MENRTKRPISVWIAQILMMFFSVLFLLPVILLVPLMFFGSGPLAIVGLLFAIVIYFGLIAALQTAFWGMARRRAYGRWVGVGILSLLLVFSIFGQIARPNGPMEYYEYDNATQAVAGLITQLVMMGLMLWLIITLATGRNVNAFFSMNEADDQPGAILE